MKPTTTLAALVAAVGVAALLLPPLFSGVLIVALIAAVALDAAGAGRPVAVRRDAPERMTVGVPGPMVLATTSGSVVAMTQPGTDTLRVHGSTPDALQLEALAAGRHTLPPAIATRLGPLRLISRRHVVGEAALITAFPAVLRRRRSVAPRQLSAFDEEGGQVRGPLGLGTSFESLRDYQQGDDVRLVNWRATARAGRPLVNQFRIEQSRDVMLLVDRGRTMREVVAGQSLLRWAVDAATGVALAANAVGDRPGLVAYDTQVVERIPPTGRSSQAIARALLGLTESREESDLRLVLASLPRKRSIVVVFANVHTDLTRTSMIDAIPVLARRHVVLVASPIVDEMDETDRGSALLVAQAHLSGRQHRLVATVRAAGADVVLETPGRFADRCVAAYLGVKSRGRA